MASKPKFETLKGNMLIAQSGGPTVVINQSLVGAVLEARKHKGIQKVFGALHGIKGILNEDFVDLGKESVGNLNLVAQTPSSALGSVRKKPTADDCAKLFPILQKYNIRYFFYIGGNDSAETTNIVYQEALKANFAFRCFHICKTIDNDLRQNDHTPGFGSAAKFVAQAFMGDNLDNRSLPGVKINVVMGRHAGFLTAASALARVFPNDGPHLVYLPERPFYMDKFVADVKGVYEKLGRCVVAVSEGIADETGTSIIAKYVKEVDSHGNIQLSGSGALGDVLADAIRATGITRVRADTFGYLQRSFPGVTSAVDAKEARSVGATAVKFAVKSHENGSVAIQRKKGKAYAVEFARVPLESVAKETRHMPDEFIAPTANDVTKAFLDYARPIVGKLPAVGRLKAVAVKKKADLARATFIPLRPGRRAAFAALAAFAAWGVAAQIPAGDPDPDEFVLRNAPLPKGGELMAQVRARLPAEPLDLLARVSTHDAATGRKVEFRAEVNLRFGARPPSATYALTDAFGAVREQLDLTWSDDGKPRYRVRRGPDLVEAARVDAADPIEGLEFAWSDLSLAFLWWDGAETVDRESMKLRGCYVVDIPAPPGSAGIAKVRLWVDRKESFVMRARLFDAKDTLLREVEADSIEQIGEIWMVKNLEIKAYPSRKKTRIMVDEVKRLAPASAPPREEWPDAQGQ